MANELLRNCKKYIVERVISPSVYCVSEYERGEDYKKEVKRFECLMAKEVEKYPEIEKIMTGEVVAVKDKHGFHRGLVTDVFNRSSKVSYWILLVDCGSVIETDRSNLYVIKNKKFTNQKLGTFEVSIHGIQPAVVKLEGDNNCLGGILQKRVSSNWSPKAFQFVRDIMDRNPCVFIRTISSSKSKRTISGEIYFIENSGNLPVSLGEKLCSKGFAVSSETSSKLTQNSLQGSTDTIIEEKIPNKALLRELQRGEILKSLEFRKGERSQMKSFHDTSDGSILASHHKSESESSSASSVFQNQSVKTCSSESLNLSSVNYSPSWILKKCQKNTPPCSATSKKDDLCDSEERESRYPEDFSGSILNVALKSMELFNKKKQFERFDRK